MYTPFFKITEICNISRQTSITLFEYLINKFGYILGFHRDADVALATPLRDGMNLFGKEFVACRINPHQRPGVLILSKFVGAADQMQVFSQMRLDFPIDNGTINASMQASK